MKRLALLVLLLSIARIDANAQNIGINVNGAAPNASALLDIDVSALGGTKRGLLIPRMTAAEMNAIVAPATSLLVFNTTASTFFFFNGTTWVPVAANAGWGLTGNAGTNPATNFLGTTDAQPLRFRVNSTLAGSLGTTSAQLVSYGVNTGLVNTGSANTFVGGAAGTANTTGHDNTFIGTFSGQTNTTGIENVYVGASAGNLNISGNGNTFIGQACSGLPSNISNATVIGHQGLVQASNAMVLGSVAGVNGATATVNVGIGVNAPLDRLHVVGSIRMVDGNQATGRIPVGNANGTMTWTDPLTVTGNVAWTLTGNTGTNPATNFLGTTDPQPLRFRVNNTFAGQVATTATGLLSLGLNAGTTSTASNNTFLGTNAGAVNTTGGNNTFIGTSAGAANTTSGSNVFVGHEAGGANASGQENVYIGRRAGGLGASGSTNVLIGNGAGILNTASNNVMIGGFAGNGATSGGGNTFLGTFAGQVNGTGAQCTFIGSNAGASTSASQGITLLGSNASTGSNGLVNATAIGLASRVDASNALVLGSVAGVNSASATSNVGIGVNAPLDRLHVVGHIRMVDGNEAVGRIPVSDANGRMTWTDPLAVASNLAWSLTGNSGTNPATQFLGTTDFQPLVMRTANLERMRVTNAGLVGIRTANPQAPLHVAAFGTISGVGGFTDAVIRGESSGNAFAYLCTPNGGQTGVLFGTPTQPLGAGIDLNIVGTGDLGLRLNNSWPMMIDGPTGNVGVGELTPDRHLEIAGSGEQFVRVTSTSGAAGVAGIELKRTGNGPSDWQIRDDGGLLLFGQSADDLATVNDVLRLGGGSVTPAVDASISCGQAGLRWSAVFAVNGAINTSDAREKQDVRPLDRGLADVMRLKPVRFRWKSDPAQGEKLGLIAQDLQQVVPEVVVDKSWRENEDGTREQVPAERLGVYYSDLIPVLINAIQEQQGEIDALKRELDAVKAGGK